MLLVYVEQLKMNSMKIFLYAILGIIGGLIIIYWISRMIMRGWLKEIERFFLKESGKIQNLNGDDVEKKIKNTRIPKMN